MDVPGAEGGDGVAAVDAGAGSGLARVAAQLARMTVRRWRRRFMEAGWAPGGSWPARAALALAVPPADLRFKPGMAIPNLRALPVTWTET
jgi:hypothetical protein